MSASQTGQRELQSHKLVAAQAKAPQEIPLAVLSKLIQGKVQVHAIVKQADVLQKDKAKVRASFL